VDNREQAEHAIRSAAERLSDTKRGEAKRRRQNKQEQQKKFSEARRALQRRYKKDPQAVIEEYTWVCSYCGTRWEPAVYGDPLQEGDVYVIAKDRCGCPGEEAARQAEEEQAEQGRNTYAQMQRQALLTRSGLRGWLAEATFETYEGILGTPEGQRKDMVREYCDSLLAGTLGASSWLVMWGEYGTGKTHLGAAVLHKAIKAGKLCYLRVWPEWLERIQSTFGGKGDAGPIIRELKRGHVVMIDDVDKYPPAKGDVVTWAQSKLFNALNERYDRRQPTILTFNHRPEEMVPWLGAANVDRLLERADAVIHCKGKSWRSQKTWNI
jgi:DNA replication protein DnaC